MRTLIKKLVNWAYCAKDDPKASTNAMTESPSHALSNVRLGLSNNKYTRFTVCQAVGGIVIETFHSSGANTMKGEPETKLYVIASMDDLPNEIAKIITYDNLLR